MKTLLDLYFAYVAQFIYNRATYMIMINSLQIYEFVCMYNARFLLYRNNTGTIHTYMYNLQIVIYRDTSPLHGHLVTKYLQIFKIQGFGYFQEDDIQLPGFYTNIPPSEFETSAPHQTQTGTPSTPPPGVKNVKIQENSAKNQGTSGGPLGTLYNPFQAPKNFLGPLGAPTNL